MSTSLYSPEDYKNNWDFGGDVGILPKASGGGSEYDAIQDEHIDDNKRHISENKTHINENDARDDRQQIEINNNTSEIIRIDSEMPTLDIDNTTLVVGKKGEGS